MTQDILFEVREVALAFEGVKALTGVDFSMRRGELTALIGPNGAGKTSLLNCINGFYRPQQGSIRLLERELLHERSHLIAVLGIARTFQNVEVLGKSSVIENVLVGRHIFIQDSILSCAIHLGAAGRNEKRNRDKVLEIIDFLGLTRDRERPVGDLPYGRQKLVEIARALAMEPKLLLLDEPTSGMTPVEKRLVGEVMQRIRREMGVTQLIIEHDMGFVMGLCDRALVLDFGRIIADGTPEQVLSMPQVISAYLGGDLERAE
jgi:branched-chain amino acid transport system ATP-binding protein